MAIKGDREALGRKELYCGKKTSCTLQLQLDCYNYCVEIRCEDTTSEE
jgi:hypothetical protein